MGERIGELIFLCPRSAREIATGIRADAAGLAASRRRMMYLECPHCLEMHAFMTAQGRVADAGCEALSKAV